ncbi:hypothetical protein D3C71_1384510 [compost metagenome]
MLLQNIPIYISFSQLIHNYARVQTSYLALFQQGQQQSCLPAPQKPAQNNYWYLHDLHSCLILLEIQESYFYISIYT